MTRKKKISEILVENRGVAGKFLWVMVNVLFSKQNVNRFKKNVFRYTNDHDRLANNKKD